jgi:NAD(P)-dependent dehydrogenase (short-subunit alcohol dehydrogenase family)
MQVGGKVVVVTGGANGIGRALCEAFHAAGARQVVVADLDFAGAAAVAGKVGGVAMACDVTSEAAVEALIADTEARVGPIELFCSNAGVLAGIDVLAENVAAASNADWQKSWDVNVMAHVYAARALIPLMRARGGGYFLNTVSAAGVLSAVGSATYSTTKHAAIGFAESLAISHRAHGIKVSVLCPQAVDTKMLRRETGGPLVDDGVLSPEEVAQAALEGIDRESFLILPHAKVADYMRVKADSYERWLGGMAKIQAQLRETAHS